MADFTPIPVGGEQGAIQVMQLAVGIEQIRPGTATVFPGFTLTGDLTLRLPRARHYAAGTGLKIIDPFGASSAANRILLFTLEGDQINGTTSASVALAGPGRAEVFSDGAGKWSVSALPVKVDNALAASLPPTVKLPPGNSLALFHCDEGTGTTLTEASGRYTGTLNGGVTWAGTDGGNVGSSTPRRVFPKGSALVFNGTSGYVSVPGLLDTIPASGMVQMWFSPAVNYPVSGRNDRLWVKSTTNLTGGNSTRLDAFLAADGKLKVGVVWGAAGGENMTLSSRTTSWAAGSWHHVAFTWSPSWLGLHIDGELHDYSVDYTLPASGAFKNFLLGAIDFGGLSGFFSGSIDEVQVLARRPLPEEIHAAYWRAPYYLGIEQSGRWNTRQDVLVPPATGNFARDLLIEICPVWTGSKFVATYTGYTLSPYRDGLGWAESADGLNWTDFGQIIGNGLGGEVHGCGTSNLYLEGGTYYIYYTDHTTGDHKLITAPVSNRTAFTTPQVMLAKSAAPGWVGDSYYNSCMTREGNVYYKLIEGGVPGNGHYVTGYATASSPSGPWTISASVLGTLQFAAGAYSAGAVSARQPDGYFYAWYHVSTVEPSPPSASIIICARSANFINWEQLSDNPVLELRGEQFSGGRSDQIADARIVEALGKVFLYYDLDRNLGISGQQGRAGVTTFNGSLTDLLKPSSISLRQNSAV